ncbi:Ig-like domain-containing protein [Paenibacillus soyae]|uniref:Ig-like domain-containing protein n=1 Tax=Paenibacillus soyae TaxID=2969249 RepID=A0A9X2MNF9_9BACL|nr:Ig-like domain-containing protein [Paenibacillus soyae]MCR2805168.1 Ig-like domain-containing protein [Paenibacillus soyae]
MSRSFRQLFTFILIAALVSASIPGGKAYALENSVEEGLMGWYKLDAPFDVAGKGVAEDSSGSNNHSVDAIGTWVPDGGVYGGALSFNGVTDLIQLNLGSAPTGSYLKDAFTEHSVSLWFKANDTQAQQVLFERGGNAAGLAIQLNANKLEAAVVSASLRTILSVDFTDTASWHHVMVTFDNGSFTMYLDGEETASASTPYRQVSAALNEAAIGAKYAVYAFGGNNQTGAWFNGMIDNVRVYNKAMSPSIEVAEVSLDKTRLVTKVGGTALLEASFQPAIATNRDVIWTSSNESVVTVSGNDSAQAVIAAQKTGSATVTARSVDGGVMASSEIIVLPELISMPLENLEAWYKLDAPLQLADKQVAEDSTGNAHHSVTALGTWLPGGGVDGGAFSLNGSSDIIQLNTTNVSFLRDEFAEFTAAMWFKPQDLNARQVLFERGGNGAGLAIQINEGKLEAAVANNTPQAGRMTLSTELTGAEEWHHVAVFFNNGDFKLFLDGHLAEEAATPFDQVAAAANEGAIGARFSVDAFEGMETGAYFHGFIDDVRLYNAAVQPVIGVVHAESVSLDRTAVTLGKGLEQELVATVLPRYATNQDVVWSSSDESVAAVTPSGGLKAVVQGLEEGTAIITVRTVDGNYSAASNVTVSNIPVSGVSLAPANVDMLVGATQVLKPAFTPANATNQKVSWSSDVTSVATVNESGVITALQAGTATITVTTDDGSHAASVNVTVRSIPVREISLNHPKITLAMNSTHLLSATIKPSNASNLNITWSSSDSSVATVDASGWVTAERPGVAIITATTVDGGFAASSEVTVNAFAVKEVDNLFRVQSGPDLGKKATLYDGTIEKYNGYYYAMGTGTNGYVYRSKDMIHWESPYQMIWSPYPTTPVDPNYFEYGASDMLFHNGAMFYTFNGTSLIYGDPGTMNTKPDFRHPYWENRYDLGIDPQLFIAHNGNLVFQRKVNPDEADPNTGAAKPGRAGAWLWNVKSFFDERGNPARGQAIETVTTQKGHWANINFVNFEGAELYYHNGQYYMLYVGNQMFPETGLYETGVAQAGDYNEITNDSKYPGKLLARNVEELILKYRVILPTAEHGGQPYQYTFTRPQAGWNGAGSNEEGWVFGEGGFGWPEENRAKIPSIYNDGKRTGAEIWAHPEGPAAMWAKRSFELDSVPETTALRYRLQGNGKLYVNGKELLAFDGQQRAYSMVEVPAGMLRTGENVIAVEISKNTSAPLNFYHLDFGLYDTKSHPVESDIVGPSQPNVIKGPNGFETWVTYKAFWNSSEGQGKDRIYFWDQEMVADGPTGYDSEGLHPDAWTPTFQDRFDSEASLGHYEIPQADVSIDNGALYLGAPGDSQRVLLQGYEAENFYMETNIRFDDNDFGDEGQAGIVVWHQDEDNYMNLLIDRDERNLVIESRIDGVSDSSATDLPSTFSFLHDDPRAADFGEQYHTLQVYKNGSKVFAELDHYTLNDDRPVFEHDAIAAKGQIGLISNKAKVRMDNVTVTTGWSEYGTYMGGWDESWSVSEEGLQSPATGKALTAKGDRLLEHEFSVNVNTEALPESGEAGVILAYFDDRNYVAAVTNYETKQFELRKVVNGREETIEAASAARDTIYGHINYEEGGQREYVYDLRGEAEISSAKILWTHGPFQYMNRFFELPDSNSADFKLDSWKEEWNAVPFSYQDKGRGDYHIADFENPVTTKQLKLSVPSESNRPFTFVVREEISSQNFYKVVRSKGKIYVWVNNKLIFDAEDPFEDRPAQAGLYTDGIQATYNALTSFDVSGTLTTDDLETGVPDGGSGPGGPPAGGGTAPTPGSKERQTDVSPEQSRQLELEEGVKIHIPAGAVSTKGTISVSVVEPDQVPASGDLQAVSRVFEMSSTAGSRFSKPLVLSFVYDAKQLKSGSQPAVYYYHESQKRWIFIGGTVNEEEGTVRVNVDHFTKFAVFAYEAATMTDMAKHWAASYVLRLAGMNVAAGYPDGSFRPEGFVTRFEFAKMLTSALGLEAASRGTGFSDDENIPSWAKQHVAAAAQTGLILGYEEDGLTSFKGDRTVTRAEAAVMTARALNLYATSVVGLTDKAPEWKDASDIPAWAKPSIDQALSAGILNGYDDGSFSASQFTSRGEAAAMIYKLLAALGI